jgi:signal transduction histidine kinase
MIRRNIETEARLVDDLLDLTRIARGKIRLHFEVVDAHAVVRNVVAMFQQAVDEKGLSVTVSLRAKQHHVWADPGRFQQVLLNLVSNALKFTARGGAVDVRVSSQAGEALIEVVDTGIGIAEKDQAQLFDRFFRSSEATERAIPGTGLGLTIVKAIVERHEGSIEVESAAGRGTTMRVRLPVTKPHAVAEDVAA